MIQFAVSIGAAVPAGQKEDIHGLLNKADQALYEAKTSGRNRVVFRG